MKKQDISSQEIIIRNPRIAKGYITLIWECVKRKEIMEA